MVEVVLVVGWRRDFDEWVRDHPQEAKHYRLVHVTPGGHQAVGVSADYIVLAGPAIWDDRSCTWRWWQQEVRPSFRPRRPRSLDGSQLPFELGSAPAHPVSEPERIGAGVTSFVVGLIMTAATTSQHSTAIRNACNATPLPGVPPGGIALMLATFDYFASKRGLSDLTLTAQSRMMTIELVAVRGSDRRPVASITLDSDELRAAQMSFEWESVIARAIGDLIDVAATSLSTPKPGEITLRGDKEQSDG